MLQQLVWILHVICAVCIIILVLLQYGKGAEMGASMGGASQTIFGSRGSGSFMTKITTVFALIFAMTSISLSFFVTQKSQIQTISEIIEATEFPEDISSTAIDPEVAESYEANGVDIHDDLPLTKQTEVKDKGK